MNPETWKNVDQYLAALFIPDDPVMAAALAASAAGGLPPIHVSPLQGRMLQLLAQVQGAQRILEIGTLGGFSTLWLARALGPAGRIVTLELDPKHAEVAQATFRRAGLADRIELRLGAAKDSLAAMAARGEPPFDFVFIDADKASIPDYYRYAVQLSRPGSVIITDNVIRKGAVIDAGSEDASVQGVRRFNEIVAGDARVTSTTIQTVGEKGYDGFTLTVVNR
jgi:predicted O-methyltransferase YrrM